MTTYNNLKKIIPPDQALANQALSRSLRQVKKIFDTDLPTLSRAVEALESNKDLPLINALTQPLPDAISTYWGNTFATGTGPGNSLTVNDLLGVASGNTTNVDLPETSNALISLASIGALNPLTGNGGTPSSAVNGVYTVMSYTLAGAYTTVTPGIPPAGDEYFITIPAPLPAQGTYGPDTSYGNVINSAFISLISNANTRINNIATAYPTETAVSNQSFGNIALQVEYNQNNLITAGIDIANIVVGNFSNANVIANQTSASLGLASRLHEFGTDITTGGKAQFFEQTADMTTITGQAVIASMREGRNIAVLNAVGINLDTQLVDVNENTTVDNNISSAQYSASEARANIVI
jgi:hypothetical protein